MMPNALGLGHDYPGRTNSDSENASARASLQAGRNESGWDPAAPKAAHGTRGGSTAIFALLLSAALPVASYAAPVVEIASPVTGATVCGTITVSAAASDPNGIAGVQFQYNGTNIGSQATAVPYTTLAYTKNVADGIYTLTAVAQSSTGQYTTSAPVSVTVNNSASYCSPKFTPTFIAYYGAAPTITSTIAQAIGKYDLVDTHRYRYYDMSSPYTWAAIKATNPNTKIYLYEMGAEDENMDDSTSQEYLQGIDRYNISRGHSMGSLNGNNSALYLLDSNSNRIYNTGSPAYWYLMDIGSPSYRSYWEEAVTTDVVSQPWVADGVHADNCLTLMSVYWPYSGIPASYPDDSHWVPVMNGFAAAITSTLHGNSQKLWSNRGGGYTGFQAGQGAWTSLDASATPPDIVGDEGAFAVSWGPSTWSTQFYPESQWRYQVDTLAAIHNSKVVLTSHTKLQESPPGDTGLDNYNQPVTFFQTLWYSLGSFSLGKIDAPNNGYFFFAGNSYSTDRTWYYDELDFLDLGKAVGPYSMTTINGTDVFSREFQKGYVYVNPTTNSVTVTLPAGCTCRQRTHDNLYTPSSQLPVVTTIQLNGHSAAFVLKT